LGGTILTGNRLVLGFWASGCRLRTLLST